MPSSSLPTFDIREVPFSRRGSWLNLSPVIGLHRTSDDIHLISHVTGIHPILRLCPTREGYPTPTTLETDPSVLTWECGKGSRIRAAFESTTALRLSGTGVDLALTEAADELTPFTGTYFFQDPLDGSYIFTSYETGRRYRITTIHGILRPTGQESLGAVGRSVTATGEDGWELAIEEITTALTPYASLESFDDIVHSAMQDFTTYLDAIAGWRTDSTPAAALAAYVLWSATVEPAGFFGRESVLMSKHWMDKLWSWDHAFNAIALAPGLPDLAIDQYLAPFDHQDVTGALPDSIAHSEVLYNFVKPPIHGWALTLLRERLPRPLTRDELAHLYQRLSAWTRFWLDYRTMPGRQLPYYQHGNDSGWDNATTFDKARVIESPDLATFILIQLDVLHDLALELGLDDAGTWQIERDRIHTALLEQLHDQSGFFAIGVWSGVPSTRTSLLTLLPVLAAHSFQSEIVESLVAGVRRHLTKWGPATQDPDTPEYESDGYWRGPIWAPSTLLIESGLRRSGHTDLADTISKRFRTLCERSGFAENFDARTGQGLRDRAYTWTASIYLILSRDSTSNHLNEQDKRS